MNGLRRCCVRYCKIVSRADMLNLCRSSLRVCLEGTKIRYPRQFLFPATSSLHNLLPATRRTYCSPEASSSVCNSTDFKIASPVEYEESVVNTVNSLLESRAHIGSGNMASHMVFAIVQFAGTQFKVVENDIVVVPHMIGVKTGDKIILNKVLLLGGRDFTIIGSPLVDNSMVTVNATVMEVSKAATVIVYKMKRRKNFDNERNHRQDITVLRINNIEIQPKLSPPCQ
eukprot:Sdes_comp21168_c0_seq1m19836